MCTQNKPYFVSLYLAYAVTPSVVCLAYSPARILLKFRQETVKNKISENTFSKLKQRVIYMNVLTQTVLDLICAGLFYCELNIFLANMHTVLLTESQAKFVTSSAPLRTWLASGIMTA